MDYTNTILDMKPAETLEVAYEEIRHELLLRVNDISVGIDSHIADARYITSLAAKLEEFSEAHETLTAKDVVSKFSPANDAA